MSVSQSVSQSVSLSVSLSVSQAVCLSVFFVSTMVRVERAGNWYIHTVAKLSNYSLYR